MGAGKRGKEWSEPISRVLYPSRVLGAVAIYLGRAVTRPLLAPLGPGLARPHLGRTHRAEQPSCAWDRRGSDQPGTVAPGQRSPLFGLAPGGVCRAGGVATTAVRSYRTGSPLPFVAKAMKGGMFSVALSVGLPPLGVTQRPALRSSDFPPRCRGGHPAHSRWNSTPPPPRSQSAAACLPAPPAQIEGGQPPLVSTAAPAAGCPPAAAGWRGAAPPSAAPGQA